jgi:gliding motility-associated-like protein
LSPFFKLKYHLFSLSFLLFPILAFGQCAPITTLYAENNGQDGIMFDVTALVDVTVTGFDCNMGETVTPYNMEIYFKPGTHVGFTTNPGAWTLIGTANNVMGIGPDVPTAIPILLAVPMAQGTTGAFYITDTGGAANIDYTNGVGVGSLYVTDGNVSIFEGTGKDYAFGADYAARVPNITMYYDCCPAPTIVEVDNSCSGLADGSVQATGQGSGPWTYQIADITGVLQTSPPTNGPYTFVGLSDGQYVVTATDVTGCTAVADAELSPLAPMTIASIITDNLCFGGTSGSVNVTVSGGSAPYDIAWTDAFANVLQLNPMSAGVATLNNLAAGSYLVGAQDQAGCTIVSSVVVTEPALAPTLNLTPQDLSCFQAGDGEVLASQNGLSPYSYMIEDVFGIPIGTGNNAGNYTFQNLDAGIYFVTVTDANGCFTTDDVELFEPAQLTAQSVVSPVLCFNGNQGTATVTSISGGSIPYGQTTWDDPLAQTGNTATTLFAGTYTASVTDANGCSLEIQFIFNNPPPLTLLPSYVTDTCGQGKGVALINVQLGTPPYAYLWKPDGITTNAHYDLEAGTYEVVVTDGNGCTDSTFVSVADDLPYPSASFDYRIEGETLIDQEVQFINQSPGTIQWTWNFGQGDVSNEKDPRFHYERAGDYLVQLLASNGYCADTAYQYVNIDPLLLVYVPNAFTPGINGTNDYFYPQGEGIELSSYDMFIYDRWGKLIWQTGNFSKKWDGTNMFSLKEVPVGTYVYLIKFREYADLDRHVYKGTVNVIRD